jgi:hypothetical protein
MRGNINVALGGALDEQDAVPRDLVCAKIDVVVDNWEEVK